MLSSLFLLLWRCNWTESFPTKTWLASLISLDLHQLKFFFKTFLLSWLGSGEMYLFWWYLLITKILTTFETHESSTKTFKQLLFDFSWCFDQFLDASPSLVLSVISAPKGSPKFKPSHWLSKLFLIQNNHIILYIAMSMEFGPVQSEWRV